MRHACAVAAVVIAQAVFAPAAQAQERRADVGLQASLTHYGEFDADEVGVGLRFGYRASRAIAVEAQLGFEPGGLGDPEFSAHRLEAQAGLLLGLDLRRSSPYLVLRGGFSSFAAAPEPIACIAIYPPTLGCVLAQGKTLPAIGFGAGYRIVAGDRAVVHIELADQMLRYPGPALGKDRERHDGDFWSHNLRVTAGVGWRF